MIDHSAWRSKNSVHRNLAAIVSRLHRWVWVRDYLNEWLVNAAFHGCSRCWHGTCPSSEGLARYAPPCVQKPPLPTYPKFIEKSTISEHIRTIFIPVPFDIMPATPSSRPSSPSRPSPRVTPYSLSSMMHPGRPAVTARPANATSRQDPIDKVILDAADKHFGVQLKAQQLAAIRSCYSGKDTIVSLPTGSGKSLCFQLMLSLIPGRQLSSARRWPKRPIRYDRLRRRSAIATGHPANTLMY